MRSFTLPEHSELMRQAQALIDEWQEEEALDLCMTAARQYPDNAASWHNLAVVEQRLGHFHRAVDSIRLAIELGADTAQSWTVLARSCQGLGHFADAQSAYRVAISHAPRLGEAHRDLAQLIWMQTGDVDAAVATLQQCLADYPEEPLLVAQLAKVLAYGRRQEDAYRILRKALTHHTAIVPLLEISAASIANGMGHHHAALEHGMRAVSAEPGNPATLLALTDAMIALDRLVPASSLLEPLHERLPRAQQVTARLCTVWRLLDDPRYAAYHDYANFVSIHDIVCPSSWPSQAAFIEDLAFALQSSHTARAHPFDQSVRNGTQTFASLYRREEPAIRAFFAFAEARAASFMTKLERGKTPFQARNTGRARIIDSWSVRQGTGGTHLNHVHQNGWISSVFYVDLPAMERDGSGQGWLNFGAPALPTARPLEPDLFVKPSVGRLVLFPSYFWHGTTPVTQAGTRLTIAFDMVPDSRPSI